MKYEFEKGSMSRPVAISRIFGPSKTDCGEKTKTLQGFLQNKQKAIDLDVESRNQSVVMEKHEIQNRNEFTLELF